jgi:hypothetical protein
MYSMAIGEVAGKRLIAACFPALLELYHHTTAFLLSYTFVAQLPGGTHSLFSSSVSQLNLLLHSTLLYLADITDCS